MKRGKWEIQLTPIEQEYLTRWRHVRKKPTGLVPWIKRHWNSRVRNKAKADLRKEIYAA
jgi:hypothetical protein